MVRCGDGFAAGADLLKAALDAAEQARHALRGSPADLACVFVSGSDHATVEAALLLASERIGARTTIGCSAWSTRFCIEPRREMTLGASRAPTWMICATSRLNAKPSFERTVIELSLSS